MKTKITLFALLLACVLISGCSLKIEAGYHGKTGRDDTTITDEFVKANYAKRNH